LVIYCDLKDCVTLLCMHHAWGVGESKK